MDAMLGAAELLQHAPQLDWLAPRIRGRSRWQVALAIPRAQRGAATGARLQLRSRLEGTGLDLPEPLSKPAAAALPTTITTSLPLGEGEIAVDLGGRLGSCARSAGSRTGRAWPSAPAASSSWRRPPGWWSAAMPRCLTRSAGPCSPADRRRRARPGAARVDVTASRLQLLGAGLTTCGCVPATPGAATEVGFEARHCRAPCGSARARRRRARRVRAPVRPGRRPGRGLAAPAADDRDALDPARCRRRRWT